MQKSDIIYRFKKRVAEIASHKSQRYNDKAKTQAGNIRVKDIMTTQKGQS